MAGFTTRAFKQLCSLTPPSNSQVELGGGTGRKSFSASYRSPKPRRVTRWIRHWTQVFNRGMSSWKRSAGRRILRIHRRELLFLRAEKKLKERDLSGGFGGKEEGNQRATKQGDSSGEVTVVVEQLMACGNGAKCRLVWDSFPSRRLDCTRILCLIFSSLPFCVLFTSKR